ncbi:MAG TPA: SAM-dependent methyltransferase [Acidobacteriaceae bacterium]|nr:SAM-dependent methyltransferase [Acidobacteriaceae bacterium]
MSKSQGSRPAAHFEQLYLANPDPWNFTTSAYEHQKYEATLAVLGCRRFHSALEVGCSIGVLTERLAGCCDQVVGVDFVAAAVASARARCAPYPGVSVELMQVPQQWPKGRFDLILFSEVLYFLNESDLLQICAHTVRSIQPGAQVLLVNYTGVTDDPCSGDKAASFFMAATASILQPIFQSHAPDYRLDLLACANAGICAS